MFAWSTEGDVNINRAPIRRTNLHWTSQLDWLAMSLHRSSVFFGVANSKDRESVTKKKIQFIQRDEKKS